MSTIILGVVADDFTGASDAASFLVEQGIKTLLFNGIPKKHVTIEEEIAVVIALKTRTIETEKAVRKSMNAFSWLKDKGAKQLYSKYCSTFDSTRKGNIGPVIDRVLEEKNIKCTVVAPALPINGRVVKNGHLYVDDIPLHETHMKDHPLTPMWDSDLSKLLRPQGRYDVLHISSKLLRKSKEDVAKLVREFGHGRKHFYIIPDYETEEDGERIIEHFGNLPFLTGGSGLMAPLGKKIRSEHRNVQIPGSQVSGKGIILAGSCSVATLQQIEAFKESGRKAIKIEPVKLIRGEQTPEDILKEVLSHKKDSILVYSSDYPENVRKAQVFGREKIALKLESTIAFIAKNVVRNNFKRIIVAGGETAGAVTKALGYDAYHIGRSIAPGVPIMIPMKNDRVRIVLKSGNFGQKDFFLKALHMTKGEDT